MAHKPQSSPIMPLQRGVVIQTNMVRCSHALLVATHMTCMARAQQRVRPRPEHLRALHCWRAMLLVPSRSHRREAQTLPQLHPSICWVCASPHQALSLKDVCVSIAEQFAQRTMQTGPFALSILLLSIPIFVESYLANPQQDGAILLAGSA